MEAIDNTGALLVPEGFNRIQAGSLFGRIEPEE